MKKINYECLLHTYLLRENGANLKKIDSDLNLVETEHKFKGGRIDILATKKDSIIGIELKSRDYQTRSICAQLLNYLQYISTIGGKIYFIAPKIKYGIYNTLQEFYEQDKLKLFEYNIIQNNYEFKEIKPFELDDYRKINYTTIQSNINDEKIKKGISIIIPDKKKAKLVENIMDTKKSKKQQLNDITQSILDIMPKEYSLLKKAYDIFKLF